MQLGKHWKLVFAAVVAITLVLAIGATRIEFATGQDSYLNRDAQIAIDNVEFQDAFGGETVILLFTANDEGTDVADLVEGDNLTELVALTEQLEAVANVRSVITQPVSMRFSTVAPWMLSTRAFTASSPMRSTRRSASDTALAAVCKKDTCSPLPRSA